MTRRYYFFTNEDALVFAAKVNTRRDALRHYETALAGDDLTTVDREFLTRQIVALRARVAELLA